MENPLNNEFPTGPVGPDAKTTNHFPSLVTSAVLGFVPSEVLAFIFTIAGPLNAAPRFGFVNSHISSGAVGLVISRAKYDEYP